MVGMVKRIQLLPTRCLQDENIYMSPPESETAIAIKRTEDILRYDVLLVAIRFDPTVFSLIIVTSNLLENY